MSEAETENNANPIGTGDLTAASMVRIFADRVQSVCFEAQIGSIRTTTTVTLRAEHAALTTRAREDAA